MTAKESMGKMKMSKHGKSGVFFLMAYIGAAIYFISKSDGGFWDVILGLLQAIVWPVYLVLNVLTVLNA
jgi:hypothetical protein